MDICHPSSAPEGQLVRAADQNPEDLMLKSWLNLMFYNKTLSVWIMHSNAVLFSDRY